MYWNTPLAKPFTPLRAVIVASMLLMSLVTCVPNQPVNDDIRAPPSTNPARGSDELPEIPSPTTDDDDGYNPSEWVHVPDAQPVAPPLDTWDHASPPYSHWIPMNTSIGVYFDQSAKDVQKLVADRHGGEAAAAVVYIAPFGLLLAGVPAGAELDLQQRARQLRKLQPTPAEAPVGENLEARQGEGQADVQAEAVREEQPEERNLDEAATPREDPHKEHSARQQSDGLDRRQAHGQDHGAAELEEEEDRGGEERPTVLEDGRAGPLDGGGAVSQGKLGAGHANSTLSDVQDWFRALVADKCVMLLQTAEGQAEAQDWLREQKDQMNGPPSKLPFYTLSTIYTKMGGGKDFLKEP